MKLTYTVNYDGSWLVRADYKGYKAWGRSVSRRLASWDAVWLVRSLAEEGLGGFLT
jgi:hypothetical protein